MIFKRKRFFGRMKYKTFIINSHVQTKHDLIFQESEKQILAKTYKLIQAGWVFVSICHHSFSYEGRKEIKPRNTI